MKPISDTSEWTFKLIQEYDYQISLIAKEYGLDTYPNQIEVVRSDQMLDAYASIGLPIMYNHWSFGKRFAYYEKSYHRGFMGLAYELVINSSPCISFLMEENTMTMQALVIAHACYGHNSFFKNNYLFKTWTDAESIIDYCVFAKNYLLTCEEKYGTDEVSKILDSCHALMSHGVDRYKRPDPISTYEEKKRQKEREDYIQKNINDLWRTIPKEQSFTVEIDESFPKEPQENLLYFIEKNAPLLEPWQREIIRIVRKIAQYFYPQRQTQVMNEGWACFWHYFLINKLYDRGLVTDGFMIEFLINHSAVIQQPPYNSNAYRGINPYALGFALFQDIKRMCEDPTKEDKEWFPDIAGSNWQVTLDFAMRNFKDESFILQFLSPKVIRDFKLFVVLDKEFTSKYRIEAIHNTDGYKEVRSKLAASYNISDLEPNIQISNVNIKGNRAITLQHIRKNNIPLYKDGEEVIKHVYNLWKFPVKLQSIRGDHIIKTLSCPKSSDDFDEDEDDMPDIPSGVFV